MNISSSILLALAGVAGLYLLAMLIVGVMVRLHGSGSRIGRVFTAWFLEQTDEYDRRTRRMNIEDEIRRALGLTDEWGTQQRADVVKAAQASLEISVLYKLLRASAHQCNGAHWAVAEGMGATEMNDAARHPLCGSRRQRVIDLADLLCDKVERYPLIADAPELIRVRFGVESIPITCTRCPYWTTPVTLAERVCPTSAMLGTGSSPTSGYGNVVEGDVLDDQRA